MASNIEIKAKVRNLSRIKFLVEQLTDTPCEVIKQEDIFFNTSIGRLKLRTFTNGNGELIYYERENKNDSKLSNYFIYKIEHPLFLKEILSKALGIKGIVSKKRFLFKVDQTRIHIDEVNNLGFFVELEFVLSQGQDLNYGKEIVADLMEKLEIKNRDLLTNSYIDYLFDKSNPTENQWKAKSASNS